MIFKVILWDSFIFAFVDFKVVQVNNFSGRTYIVTLYNKILFCRKEDTFIYRYNTAITIGYIYVTNFG